MNVYFIDLTDSEASNLSFTYALGLRGSVVTHEICTLVLLVPYIARVGHNIWLHGTLD